MGASIEERARLVAGAGFWRTVAASGIPALVLSDGPHGIRLQREDGDSLGVGESVEATCFPPAAGIASSWNPALVERVGVALGRECRALGVDVLLGPGVNIKRSPLCGRNFEYFSEDPLLTGALGTAWVRGLQSQGVGASLKHFAVNNQETNRMRVSAVVDERTLRELYLPAFERIVREARPMTVMTAYNRVNGVYATEHAGLVEGILRREWGFDGLVLSDWGAVVDRVAALAAGTDLEMPGPAPHSERAIVRAIAAGDLDEAVLDRAARRLGTLAARLADARRPAVARLADRGHVPAPRTGPASDRPGDAWRVEHHALAREAARESMVLLRNEGGVLPLAAEARVALLGELARSPRIQGAGSSRVRPTRVDTPLAALAARLPDSVFAPGYAFDGAPRPELMRGAVAAAAAAELAVVFVGLPTSAESEGYDRTGLDLPAEQVAMLRAVAAVQPRCVVVIAGGGVVSLEPWHDEVAAVVESWLLGQAAGEALADVLLGTVDASGRLAETIPFRLEDTPSYLSFPGEGEEVRHTEGLYVGYRHYASVRRAVRHPFGFGLSYTTFAWSDARADARRASVTVTNTGTRAGSEVVQLYATPAAAAPRSPVIALAGFAKVTLAPGSSRRVTVELPARVWQHWDVAAGCWRTAGGVRELRFQRDAERVEAVVAVRVRGDVPPVRLSLDSAVQDWLDHPVTGPVLRIATRGQSDVEEGGTGVLDMVASMSLERVLRFPGVAIPRAPLRALATVANLPPVRGLARLLGARLARERSGDRKRRS
ncbi:MAG: glycoside hydrolase family 3 C-terminal domain-containing protein [Microbacteriaceae bacterium]